MSQEKTHRVSLTALQEGMIFHHLLDGRHSGVDVEQLVGNLGEPLDEDAFVQAWEQVIARHAILRTTVRWEGRDVPEGQVHPAVDLPVHREDLSHLEPEARELRFEEFLAMDRARGLRLTTPPLMRLALFRLGAFSWRMVWTVHHLLVDGRTFALLLGEVFDIYEASLEGRPLPTADRPPYDAYVEWIRSRNPESSRRFWTDMLEGIQEPTPLPFRQDAKSGAEPGAREIYSRHVAPETVGRLRDAAREEGATLNTFFQAAWALTLSRFAGTPDVTFGAIRGGRAGTVPGADEMIGLFVHTLPVRVKLGDAGNLRSLVRSLRSQWIEMRAHEFVPLARIQEWSRVPSGTPLFHSVVNFQDPPWSESLKRMGGKWQARTFDVRNQLAYPLMVRGAAGEDLLIRLEYDPTWLDGSTVERMAARMTGLLEEFRWEPAAPLHAFTGPLREERESLLHPHNDTQTPLPKRATIHGLIEVQAGRTPDRPAVLQGDRSWTYRELMRHSSRIASTLTDRGIGRGDRVGILMERTPEMVAALLGTLRAGAAYVPIDPEYPADRIRLIAQDAELAVVLSSSSLARHFPEGAAPVLNVDGEAVGAAGEVDAQSPRRARSFDPAYVMYTSGSTGRPKGVVVEHRNVVNFFAGMDDRVGDANPGTWLAVTSISFDISVLELLWTLARGFRIALHPDRTRRRTVPGRASAGGGPPAGSMNGRSAAVDEASSSVDGATSSRDAAEMRFGLFYFSAESGRGSEAPGPERYRLLMEGARFADEHGMEAVWTPERHFHPFGGIYPNPSVISAALAAQTRRVRIRAGSVVLPLHDPIRVAEEWAVVDNLSGGRVDVSFTSGWHDRDFVLAPDRYKNRREDMLRQIGTVRSLWRGETIFRVKPDGTEVAVQLHPTPVQKELPFFVTAGGSPGTFRAAGEMGAGLLTHLLGQSPTELENRISLYREAWRTAGHPGEGTVVLMIHTFLGRNEEEVKSKVREPFRAYLRSSVGLIADLAQQRGRDLRSADFTEEDMEALLDHAFDRYFESSALMGTPERGRAMVEGLRARGVDELACLIDFGVDVDDVLQSLHLLPELWRPQAAPTVPEPAPSEEQDPIPATVGAAIRKYGVTHLQCTPSLLRLLLEEEETRQELHKLEVLLVGGEAFPGSLAAKTLEVTRGEVLNMYGPTETTIWSSTHRVAPEDVRDAIVPIGRPIANTGLYVLDGDGVPVPIGVTGELWIGGTGVARGYHRRPELTKERFVGGRLPGIQGRLYRTGDLVRRRDDGVLTFVGRVDDQVKLRGHRIELGEIEGVLNEHPSVEHSIVVRREEGDETRLVAYVVPAESLSPGEMPRADDLRRWLGERLPEVMVPSSFVVLHELPLTPNGKVDRKRLPVPGHDPQTLTEPALESGLSGPADGMERAIADVWAEVLQVPQVGLNDNFFELGGHSLLTIRVQDRLRSRVDATVTVRDLFRFTTVRALARHLSNPELSDVGEAAVEAVTSRAEARRGARRRMKRGRSATP